nr:hypothetical protein [Dulcicalothrix desertica]
MLQIFLILQHGRNVYFSLLHSLVASSIFDLLINQSHFAAISEPGQTSVLLKVCLYQSQLWVFVSAKHFAIHPG